MDSVNFGGKSSLSFTITIRVVLVDLALSPRSYLQSQRKTIYQTKRRGELKRNRKIHLQCKKSAKKKNREKFGYAKLPTFIFDNTPGQLIIQGALNWIKWILHRLILC